MAKPKSLLVRDYAEAIQRERFVNLKVKGYLLIFKKDALCYRARIVDRSVFQKFNQDSLSASSSESTRAKLIQWIALKSPLSCWEFQILRLGWWITFLFPRWTGGSTRWLENRFLAPWQRRAKCQREDLVDWASAFESGPCRFGRESASNRKCVWPQTHSVSSFNLLVFQADFVSLISCPLTFKAS